MAKKLRYVCSHCSHEETGWTGKCPACGTWGSMEETMVETKSAKRARGGQQVKQERAQLLKDVELASSERLDTGMEELNRVLGGGLVRDSVSMLTAKPGAGKSTLLLQVAGKMAEMNIPTLYASGEESSSQIKARALRVLGDISSDIYLLSTNSMDVLINEMNRIKPQVVIVDSVQTFALDEYPQRQGSPTQTVQVTASLVDACKQGERPIAAFLVGHMTKGDEMAGLRTLEHLVDSVLYLESSNDESLRVLRSTKNRFGYTGEIGLFQMTEAGLEEVTAPFDLFLTKRETAISGSAISLQSEGSRLIPIEIEALVSPSYAAYPIRIGDTMRRDTLNTLVSILEQKANFSMGNKNVVIKATGGLSISEKVCDLAILVAIASSDLDRPVSGDVAFLAEVGLTGELKRVSQMERRLKELDRIGFKEVYIPTGYQVPKLQKLKVHECRTLSEVFSRILS